ncbi:MAG TPA: phage recombination protein Bet [Fimbriimonas sp.]
MAANTAEILRLAPAQETPEWESKLDLVKRTVAAGATGDELDLFFYQARRTGLDPLARQIYYVKRKGKGTIQVGIDGLRLIADRTGQYAGSDDAEFLGTTDEGYPAKARVTVYKMVQGQRCPFTATARWDEYYPGPDQGFQWRKMPHAMLAKCAEALALRKAFPADMSGLYVHEEMMQADRPVEAPVLEGRDLNDVAEKVFESNPEPRAPKAAAAPDGKVAFGYVPVRWPLAKMFAEPMTDSQRKMIGAKASERTIPEEDLGSVRRLVLEAYGLADEPTKACASLFIDWLINADEEHLDAAVQAAEGAAQDNEPLEA